MLAMVIKFDEKQKERNFVSEKTPKSQKEKIGAGELRGELVMTIQNGNPLKT